MEHEDKFNDQEIESLNDFVDELQAESLLVLLNMLTGGGEDEKKKENERITRAEELKQFAIDNADCPEDLDHSYFTETQVYKKVQELLDNSNPEEAFKIMLKAFPGRASQERSLDQTAFYPDCFRTV